jgi:hypothetical protein
MARTTKGGGSASAPQLAETLARLASEFGATAAAGSGDEGVIQGSIVRAEYVERTMRFWLITKPEMDTVSYMNTQANIFFGLGGFFISSAIGFIGDYKLTAQPSDIDRLLAYYGGGTAILIAIAFFGLAIWALNKKSNTIKDIKTESKVIEIRAGQ